MIPHVNCILKPDLTTYMNGFLGQSILLDTVPIGMTEKRINCAENVCI